MLFPEFHSGERNSMKPSGAFFKGLYRRIFRRPEQKVFVVGFHKTGTSSLGRAFQILGYKVCGSLKEGYDFSEQDEPMEEFLMKKASSLLKTYDAFQDTPWFLLYRQLYDRFPDGKFILSLRDEDAWLKSVRSHFGKGSFPYHDYIYSSRDSIAEGDMYIDRYREHNHDVRHYFSDKPGSLLVIDLQQNKTPWKDLCEFLDVKVPNTEFPHVNKGSSRNSLRRRLKRLFKKHYYRP